LPYELFSNPNYKYEVFMSLNDFVVDSFFENALLIVDFKGESLFEF
jgi:hypothetical protein